MTFGVPYNDGVTGRMLHFLILTEDKEIVSASLREGVDFLDDLAADFGPEFYVLATAE